MSLSKRDYVSAFTASVFCFHTPIGAFAIRYGLAVVRVLPAILVLVAVGCEMFVSKSSAKTILNLGDEFCGDRVGAYGFVGRAVRRYSGVQRVEAPLCRTLRLSLPLGGQEKQFIRNSYPSPK